MNEPKPKVTELMAEFGARWDDTEQGWKDRDGCGYAAPFDVLQVKEFGFCGCGLVGGALPYVRKGLRYIASLNADRRDIPEWAVHDEEYWNDVAKKDAVARCEALGDESAAYFFFWWADDKGYTDHGSCLPGWLTDKGKALLELLDLLAAEPDWEGEK